MSIMLNIKIMERMECMYNIQPNDGKSIKYCAAIDAERNGIR